MPATNYSKRCTVFLLGTQETVAVKLLPGEISRIRQSTRDNFVGSFVFKRTNDVSHRVLKLKSILLIHSPVVVQFIFPKA